jgi:hypothetical protein
MSRPKRVPNSLPNVVLEFGVRRVRNRLARPVIRGNLRDRVAAGAVFGVAKTGVIGLEVNDPHFNVVE